MLNISCLDKNDYDNYTRFLLEDERNLFYVSINYKQLLKKLLGCESCYFVARGTEGKIIGIFPLMISKSGRFGRVVNSLPYYGSNGGIIVTNTLPVDERSKIKHDLLQAAEDYIKSMRCAAHTVIINPFERDTAFYKQNVAHDYIDERIGLITSLPDIGPDIDARLMSIFENPRPRNIRKAIKSAVISRFSQTKEDLDFLYLVHRENMTAIGGLPKDEKFFRLIPEVFSNSDYRVYVAEKDGKKIAALLLFYFNKTVEYYTPAVVKSARSLQPTALLIYEAMKDAIADGFQYWNWGGTWLSQKGVYDFKKRWGAKDYPYYYYIKLHEKQILSCTSKELLKEYPGFFVIPFNRLKKDKKYGD